MAVASYTEDLTDFATGDESTGWSEFTSLSYNGQSSVTMQDPDYGTIQGTYAAVQQCKKDSTIGSIGYNAGSGTGGHGTDGAYLIWQSYAINQNVDSYANGGLRAIVGSSYADFKSWDVGGLDKAPYPYGGWTCHAVNTTVTADDTGGTPTATEQYVGAAVNVTTGSSKGEPHAVDAIRYGRCSAIFQDGQAADYCDIAGFAAANDATTARWGLIQETSGGYLWQGRMLFGSTNACDFRDSDVTIFVKWTPKVTANFNTIDNNHASNNIEMTGFQFICLDTSTASRGRWITTANGTATLLSCTFVDMSTFAFGTNTTATNCTWKRCDQIDPNGGDISNALIDQPIVSADTGAILWNTSGNPDTKLDGSTIKSHATTAHHAIEFGTSAPTTISFTDMTFTDFNTADGQNDSVLLFPDTGSDVTWTVTHTGTTGTLSYKKARATDTVTITSSVTVTVEVLDDDTGTGINLAHVQLFKTSDYSTVVMSAATNASGIATASYTGATPADVEGWARNLDHVGTDYEPQNIAGEITSSGLSILVRLKPITY